MIRRELHPTGLRLVTEAMPHVRSVSIGVWLTRGSRHESDARSGIAHFVEHMLFKGTEGRSAEDIAQEIDSVGGHLDAFTSKEYAGYYIKVLDEHLPQGRRPPLRHRPPAALRARRHREGEEGHPRRDQDGRGHPRRSGPRDPHRAVLARPPARTPDSRRAGDGGGALREGRSPSYFAETYVASNFIVSAAGNLEHDRLSALVARGLRRRAEDAGRPSTAPARRQRAA